MEWQFPVELAVISPTLKNAKNAIVNAEENKIVSYLEEQIVPRTCTILVKRDGVIGCLRSCLPFSLDIPTISFLARKDCVVSGFPSNLHLNEIPAIYALAVDGARPNADRYAINSIIWCRGGGQS